MARGQNIDPDVYFGKPGALVKMPWPWDGMEAPVDRNIYDFVSGSGNHRVSTLLGTSRSYQLSWRALHQETFDRLAAYWAGLYGPGPYAFIDPSRPNLLTPNQSGACSVWYSAKDFQGGGTGHGGPFPNKVATYIFRERAPRSLQWLQSATPTTTPTMTLSHPYARWYGTPVVPGLPYTFSCMGRPDNVLDSSVNIGLNLVWIDSAGATISTTSLAPSAVTAWTPLFVTGVAPVNAAFVSPQITLTGATVAASSSVYLDLFQLEQSAVKNIWAPGTGVMPMAMMGFTEAVPFDGWFRLAPVLNLREVL